VLSLLAFFALVVVSQAAGLGPCGGPGELFICLALGALVTSAGFGLASVVAVRAEARRAKLAAIRRAKA
jgi:hypothetical protein